MNGYGCMPGKKREGKKIKIWGRVVNKT